MSETFTLERLFEAFPGGIRIPRIQRGYVQGRDDEKGKEIRANFVPKLVDAVFNGKDLSLDFIYGVAGSDGEGRRCLLPLDGQQRLTTLFLLAWLCGKWNREWHFSYESRRIPQLFFAALVVGFAVGASACMTFIAGKKVSTTGHVIVGHNEDDWPPFTVHHGMLPARDWPAGTMLPAHW